MASGEGRIERRLLCELTDEDIQSRGRMLAETVVQIDLVMSEKREASKVFNQKLEGLGEQQRELTKAIRDRAEHRIIVCAVRFHEPAEGMKRTVRIDTGECIEETEMTAGETQLHLFASQAELAQFMADQGVGPSTPAENAPSLDACGGCGYAREKCECRQAPEPDTQQAGAPAPECANCNHAGEWHDEESGTCGMLDCACAGYIAKQE